MLQPLNDGVVVKVTKTDGKTKGGLLTVPGTDMERSARGVVSAVGPGRLLSTGVRVASDVKAGDTVVYNKHAGVELKEDGEDLVVLVETDLLAVVK